MTFCSEFTAQNISTRQHLFETLTFDGDAGGYRRLPPAVATPGHTHLVADVVSGLTEEMDGALLGEASTRGRIAAETSMFGHQRVGAVAQSAFRNTEQRDESGSLKGDTLSLSLLLLLLLCSTHAFVFFCFEEEFKHPAFLTPSFHMQLSDMELSLQCKTSDFFSLCAVQQHLRRHCGPWMLPVYSNCIIIL